LFTFTPFIPKILINCILIFKGFERVWLTLNGSTMKKFKDVNIFTANVRGLMNNLKLIEAENLNEYSI
jgi:hypothetical protein